MRKNVTTDKGIGTTCLERCIPVKRWNITCGLDQNDNDCPYYELWA